MREGERRQARIAGPHREPWLIRIASRGYAPALDWALANERKVMAAAVAALVAAGFVYTNLAQELHDVQVANEGRNM